MGRKPDWSVGVPKKSSQFSLATLFPLILIHLFNYHYLSGFCDLDIAMPSLKIGDKFSS
jgi:hypothetical protein